MTPYTKKAIETFALQEDREAAKKMAQYMRNKFDYFGIASPLRKEISKNLLVKSALPPLDEVPQIVQELWEQPQRELQYFALELLQKYSKEVPAAWIDLYEKLIITKSWWDTVDGLAAWQVGGIFKKYRKLKIPVTKKWMESENLWLQRTCLIFQLRYKEQTDFELMQTYIAALAGHQDFFIRKAIGWALRQYGKFRPEEVKSFVNRQQLSELSRREAMKLINSKSS